MATSMYAATQEFYRVDKQVIVAALYVRNSDTTKMDTEVQKAQLEALLKYAKEHGYEVREHLIFKEAVSAIKVPYWERKELLRLWDESERGSFDVVLVTEMFRIARLASEQFAVIEHFRRYNVRVESISERFEDTSEGRLLMSIQGFLGEVEANKIAIRTARGRLHRAKQALSGQGQPAYGYVWQDSKDYHKACYALSTRVFSDNEGREWTEVKVVAWVYEGCLAGMSLRQIAKTLSQMGVPTRENREVWGVATIRKILIDRKYTGRAIFTTDEGEVVLNDLVPRIISDEVFESAQIQLTRNSEMSPRNNKYPKATLMRGLVYCGICSWRMHVKHYSPAQSTSVMRTIYKCFRNDGIEGQFHKHTVSVLCSSVDEAAWEFAVMYIRNPELFSQHVKSIEKEIPNLNHSEGIEESLNKISQAITNLYKLAEVAIETKPLEERLIDLQLKKRELEKLHRGVLNTEEKQENLRLALERFRLWAESQRQFLDDPEYQPTFEDKLSAIYFLGIKATVYPLEDNPKRIKLEFMPPDIQRLLRMGCSRITYSL